MSKFESYFKKLIAGENLSFVDKLCFLILRLIGAIYALIMYLRSFFYAIGIFRSYKLPKPVISVGNITMGGTGKTPTVAWLARHFINRGKEVVVLTRGYGGSLEGETLVVSDGIKRILLPEEAGDEPCLLADMTPGLIVVMGSNRYEAGSLAIKQFQPDIFILDDGFQHMKLKRDLNILLIDYAKPFGNGFTFPAGTLRESLSAIKRSDILLFTRCEENRKPNVKIPWNIPAFTSSHRLCGVKKLVGGAIVDFEHLKGKIGVAFAGIAKPDEFFDSLETEGLNIVATLTFSDHTEYGEEEIAALAKLLKSSKADYLITTAKDGIKLHGEDGEDYPCYVALLELEVNEEGLFLERVEKVIA
ncbi:MAG: tetraacyldisaccharide 4'-kinase [Desulfuromonadales bacterium]|nr:tetraacyldisaccharide 4'-kinase [Desulfuromonadales bacterium]